MHKLLKAQKLMQTCKLVDMAGMGSTKSETGFLLGFLSRELKLQNVINPCGFFGYIIAKTVGKQPIQTEIFIHTQPEEQSGWCKIH